MLQGPELAEPVIYVPESSDARHGIETVVKNAAYFHKRIHLVKSSHNKEKTLLYPGWQNDLNQFEVIWHTTFDPASVTQNAIIHIEANHIISAGGLGLLYNSARKNNYRCSRFGMSTRLNPTDTSFAYGFVLLLHWLDLLRSTFYLFSFQRYGDVVMQTLTRSYPNRSSLTQNSCWRCCWFTDSAFTIRGFEAATQNVASGTQHLLQYVRQQNSIWSVFWVLPFIVYYWTSSIPWWNMYMPIWLLVRNPLSSVSIFIYIMQTVFIAILGKNTTTLPIWMIILLAAAYPLYLTVLPLVIVVAKLT